VDALDRILTAYVEPQAAPGNQDTWRLRVHLVGEAVRNPKVNALFRETVAEVFARLAVLVREGQDRGRDRCRLDPVSVARVIAARAQRHRAAANDRSDPWARPGAWT
jgi:hypothetical protein